ncbi:hypothetical protein BO83DRAFT_454768 [Aspergillus eucalypticola CBS 122712]|uniref:Uncharacterized protein n=1 Tax=Aspergillus eucalypticola (strain CBS 122712 / IBT 29274) TaxID=1448314 RepID=A0A317WBX0_ASPEC|nr:uncharacterized protein BO83DRAFT_454768 [Aspergillus eucalypticola CBS 122712]PWY82752.1 hypothetical protein BO83DRAFT_454768 [Aspergillus eucalypticola CBS 122712]
MFSSTVIYFLYLPLLLASNVQAFNTIHTNCTLPPQHANFVTAPNTRGTLQILWSSLFTILACTWTVLHLNVPEYAPKPEIKDFRKWLKWMVDKYQHPTKWFLLTVFAPEIPFAKYWDDQVRGHSLFYHYEAVFRKRNWTRTHVLFANMGGFALRCTADSEEGGPVSKNEKATTEDQDDHQTSTSPLVEDAISLTGGPSTLKSIASASCCEKPEKQIQSTLIGDPAKKFEEVFYLTAVEALKLLYNEEKSIPGLENVSEEEINARSKSDMFMRLLAVGQIVWVVIQILSRWAYGLAVTQLEVTVVAFAFCAVGMYIVNHGKPKGVELPLLFDYPGTKKALRRELEKFNFPDHGGKHSKWKFYKCKYCTKEKIQSDGGTSKDNKRSSDGNDKNHEPANNNDSTEAKSETISLDTFTAIVQWVRTTLESSRDPGDPIGNGFIDESEDPSKLSNVLTDLWMFIGSMIFGGIHLIAWDFQFPTTVEKYLWWAASLWCTACVLISTLLYFVILVLSGIMEVVNEAIKHDNSSTPEDAKPDDPAGQAPTVSSTSPNQVQANPNTELDTELSPGPKEIPSLEAEQPAPPPEDSQRDIESQDSPPRRPETIKVLVDLAYVVLALFRLCYVFLSIFLLILLMLLGVIGMLAYIVARLFIVVEMFRTLAFLPPDAYIATWSSEIPNIG